MSSVTSPTTIAAQTYLRRRSLTPGALVTLTSQTGSRRAPANYRAGWRRNVIIVVGFIHTAPSKVTTVQYTSARTMLDSSIEGVSRAFDYSEVVFQRYLELTSFTRRTLGVASISQRITECLMQMSSGYYVVPTVETRATFPFTSRVP